MLGFSTFLIYRLKFLCLYNFIVFKYVLEIPGYQFVTTELTTKRLLQSYVDKKDILKEKVNTVKPCQIDYMFHRLTRPIIMHHNILKGLVRLNY